VKQRSLLPGLTEHIQDRTQGISEGPKLLRVMDNKKLDAKNKVTWIERKKKPHEVLKAARLLKRQYQLKKQRLASL